MSSEASGAAARFDLAVRFYELDPYGHVNHATYLQYFEAARVAWLGEVGQGLDILKDSGVQLVVTAASVRFVASALLGETLAIETAMVKMARVRSQWAQVAWRDDQVVAAQRVNFATVSLESKPIRVPDSLSTAMRTIAVDPDWHAKVLPALNL